MTGGRGTRFFRQGFAGSAMHPFMSEMTRSSKNAEGSWAVQSGRRLHAKAMRRSGPEMSSRVCAVTYRDSGTRRRYGMCGSKQRLPIPALWTS